MRSSLSVNAVTYRLPALMRIAALFVATLALCTTACGSRQKNPACTEMACQNGMRIGLRPASGVWPKGTYRFQVLADDASTSCTSTMPLPKHSDKPACSSDFALLEESGALLGAGEQKFGGIQVLRAAEKITVRVFRDGKELVMGTYAPSYRSVEPNGPGCPPTCKQGVDSEMVVP